MLLFVGAIIVLGSVLGGFMIHGGHVLVLNQPTEFIIIGGAALGSVVISTPIRVLKALVGQLKGLLGSAPRKPEYLDLLAMMYQLFRVIQQSGIMSLESHVEKPDESPILSKYPNFLGRHVSACFLADSVKVMILGGISAFDLETLMDEDLHVHHSEALKPSGAVNKVSDAMPGLGIVAAVLGIVITMGIIDGPPAEIGHSVAAALVGTFLGILISYGFLRAAGDQSRASRRRRGPLRALHQSGPAVGLQGAAAGDCGRVRTARASARRAAVVRRDRGGLQGFQADPAAAAA